VMNHVEVMNAVSLEMLGGFKRALDVIEKPESGVRCVLWTGEGRGFCTGANLAGGAGSSDFDPESRDAGLALETTYHPFLRRIRNLKVPVITAVNGPAAGVGLVLAAYADLRFAVPGAKFTAAHGRFNFPAEYGLSWLLPRIVGLTHANDILLSSRVFTSEEALAMGFLNRLLPPAELMPHVLDYAGRMAEGVSPGSLRVTKNQIYRDLHRDAASAVNEAERLLSEMATHPDYKEGVKAWMEKRKAQWQG